MRVTGHHLLKTRACRVAVPPRVSKVLALPGMELAIKLITLSSLVQRVLVGVQGWRVVLCPIFQK